MSVIEDVQDLVAPDLKAITSELAGLQKSAAASFLSAEKLADARHNKLLAKLETFDAKHTARSDAIMHALDIDKRLEALERGEYKSSKSRPTQ